MVPEKTTASTKPNSVNALKLKKVGDGQFAQREPAKDERFQLPPHAPAEPSGLPRSSRRRAAARGQPDRRPTARGEPPRRASPRPAPARRRCPPPAAASRPFLPTAPGPDGRAAPPRRSALRSPLHPHPRPLSPRRSPGGKRLTGQVGESGVPGEVAGRDGRGRGRGTEDAAGRWQRPPAAGTREGVRERARGRRRCRLQWVTSVGTGSAHRAGPELRAPLPLSNRRAEQPLLPSAPHIPRRRRAPPPPGAHRTPRPPYSPASSPGHPRSAPHPGRGGGVGGAGRGAGERVRAELEVSGTSGGRTRGYRGLGQVRAGGSPPGAGNKSGFQGAECACGCCEDPTSSQSLAANQVAAGIRRAAR